MNSDSRPGVKVAKWDWYKIATWIIVMPWVVIGAAYFWFDIALLNATAVIIFVIMTTAVVIFALAHDWIYLKDRKAKIILLVVLAVVGAVGLLEWRNQPTYIVGGGNHNLFEESEVQRGDYTLNVKPEASFSELVELKYFEGYTPDSWVDFREKYRDNDKEYRTVSSDHSYHEYISKYGRVQMHDVNGSTEFDGASWVTFCPSDLPVDKFFKSEVAILFDLSDPEFTIYLHQKDKGLWMIVTVKNWKVESLRWDED